MSGGTKVRESVLLYDELGDHSGASCAEVLADKGANVELAFRGHQAAERSGYVNYPVYLKHYYEKGVVLTPDRRLEKVEKMGDQLRAVFANELTGQLEDRISDQIVVERGTVPVDDLYEELKPGSCGDSYQIFKVGDAVSSRDIHCAILDSRRLCGEL